MDAGAFALTEAVYPPTMQLPRHAHSCATISFVLKGSCTETIGNSVYECAPFGTILKPPGEVHSNQYGRAGAKCLLIEIKPPGLESIRTFSGIVDQIVHVQELPVSGLAIRIHGEFKNPDSASALTIEGLVLEMLGAATRRSIILSAPKPPRWLRDARDLCDECFPQPISLISVAAAVQIHPAHLARMFRKHYRCTLGEYVRSLRLNRAAQDLIQTDKSLVEIALEAGFYDHSHFTHTFKRRSGITPMEFREAHKRCKPGTSTL
jgi:AraC family transcriptional regulator